MFGYTIGNDVSERTWQRDDRTLWRAKNTDTFKPMGPWIDTDVDLDALRNQCAAERRGVDALPDQRHDLRRRHLHQRDVAVLHALSRRRDLDGHRRPSPNIKAGDMVEVEITGIGMLRNRFVRATA